MTTDALLGDDFETRLLPLAPDAEESSTRR